MPGNEVLVTDTGDWTADVTGSSGELANEDTEPSGTALDRKETVRQEESPLRITGRWVYED